MKKEMRRKNMKKEMKTKARTVRKITRLVRKIRKIHIKYIRSLPPEVTGNIEHPEYISIACFNGSIMFNGDSGLAEYEVHHWEEIKNAQDNNKA